ncbi:hypothetical protein [Leifsonia sp. WHRI 6310E]|uniref:hypothetical protein n=1 Tax=Leifsonia sp. WHRI 6310E TaxID=3162562 RepID=UPI0032EECE67
MNRETPHAMPPSIRDDVEMKLGDRELTVLDDSGRFVVRRLIADAYAKGFQDGYFQHLREADTDRQANRESVDSGSEADRG